MNCIVSIEFPPLQKPRQKLLNNFLQDGPTQKKMRRGRGGMDWTSDDIGF